MLKMSYKIKNIDRKFKKKIYTFKIMFGYK